MEDYFKFEGNQNSCAKIWFVLLHRIQLFYRSSFQWAATLIPLAFVAMMCFQFYSIFRTTMKDPDQ